MIPPKWVRGCVADHTGLVPFCDPEYCANVRKKPRSFEEFPSGVSGGRAGCPRVAGLSNLHGLRASVFTTDARNGNYLAPKRAFARADLTHASCIRSQPSNIAGPVGRCDCLSEQQVDNAALAILERRELDLEKRADLGRAMDKACAAPGCRPATSG